MHRLGPVLALTLVACEPDVSVEERGGAGGGIGGAGGVGGTGGAEPLPLPGCEELVPNGAPFMVPAPFGAYNGAGAIAPLPDDEILVVYMTSEAAGVWDTVSTSIAAPFSAWPPEEIAPALEHVKSPFYHRTLVTRADGAFIARTNETVWGAVHGVAGAFYESSSFGPIRRAHLEPNGTGYYQTEADELRYYAALTDTDPSATLLLPDTWGGESGADAEGRLVMSAAGWLYSVEGVTVTPFAEAPPELAYSAIHPRAEGGIWLAGKRTGPPAAGTVEVWAIDDAGSELTKPLGDFTANDVGFAGWQDGVVIAAGDAGGGFRLAITDGVHVTKLAVPQQAATSGQNGISVVASPDGAALLVGYLHSPSTTEFGFAIQRFDCSSP